MSYQEVSEPEDLIMCPYDRVHMVRAKRFPYHLMKCRRNYRGTDYAVCPFNARHEMPRPELRYHMANCPDRVVLNRELLHDEERQARGSDLPAADWVPPPEKENWNNELPTFPGMGVEVDESSRDGTIIKDLTGMTPAEKKRHHQRLLINFERRLQGLPPLSDSDHEDSNSDSGQEQAATIGGGGSELRRPHKQPQVLQIAQQQQRQQSQQTGQPPQQKPSNVFAYSVKSVNMGEKLGRGRGILGLKTNPNPPAPAVGRSAAQVNGGPTKVTNGPSNVNGGKTEAAAATAAAAVAPVRKPRIAANIFSEPPQGAEAAGPKSHTNMGGLTRESGTLGDHVAVLQAITRGRGIGRGTPLDSYLPTPGQGASSGEPQFIVPKVGDSVSTVANGSSEYDSPSEAENAEDQRKEIRKLQKKLRGIEALEQKQAAGQELNMDEKEKLSQKAGILRQLADLGV